MAEKPHGGKVGRYRIVEPLGSGGFATVYRAVDERLGSEVALKVLAENHSLVPDYRERFISEAQHLRRVDSYWVASIFDLGETETGQPYMVLELADRGDLETRVNDLWDRGRSLEQDDVLVLAETLAYSLSAIHAADLVHRDVTPGNLLVRHNGLRPEAWTSQALLDRGERMLLSDLGYAKDLRAASGITSGGGTVGFAAPEQSGPMTQVDERADVYGATAVLQWAAAGSRFEQALSEVARIGMAPEPGDRYTDISSWHLAVRGAVTGPFNPDAISDGQIEETEPMWARPLWAAVAGASIGIISAGLLFRAPTPDENEPASASTSTTVETTTTTTTPTTTDGPGLPESDGEPPTSVEPEGLSEVPPVTADSSSRTPPVGS
ncbi:MAG: serine/threonine-protein kinase [Actinomycetota bacterium]